MDQRLAELLQSRSDNLATFTTECPLLLVVAEEYPGLLALTQADDDAEGRRGGARLEPQIKRAVKRLIQEGAKVGIRVFVMLQRADAATLGGTERSNLAARASFRVDNGDAVRMLHESADTLTLEALKTSAPGVGIIEHPGLPLTRFRADWLDYERYLAAIDRINT